MQPVTMTGRSPSARRRWRRALSALAESRKPQVLTSTRSAPWWLRELVALGAQARDDPLGIDQRLGAAERDEGDLGVEVEAHLFPRRRIERLGIAPLTSMFFVSENDRRFLTEFRPEVHDSDGLLLHNGSGEWLWRPLRNPPTVRISSFMDKTPRGFGLMQREREFGRYEDLEARYDLRPSYWVEPTGDWGKGRIELVELPAADETEDNIVAFWVAADPVEAGEAIARSWRMRVLGSGGDLHAGGRVRATFQGEARPAGARSPAPPHTRRFLVDFAGGDLAYFLRQPDRIELVPSVSRGRIDRHFLIPHPVIGGFRAGIDVAVEPGETSDIRVYLRSGERALSETWTFPWTNELG
jgi:glucans biosynthesis protein